VAAFCVACSDGEAPGGAASVRGLEASSPGAHLVHALATDRGVLAYRQWRARPGGFSDHGVEATTLSPGAFGGSVLAGDVSGDGLSDLVQVYPDTLTGANNYWSWLGGHDGGFAANASHGYFGIGGQYNGSFLLGDIDANGTDDLIQIYESGGRVAYWSWIASSHLAMSPTFGNHDIGAWDQGTFLVGRIDGDQQADLLQIHAEAGRVAYRVWRAVGPGWFHPTPTFAGILNAAFEGFFLLGDVDGAGGDDLVQVFGVGGTLAYHSWLGHGSGFAPGPSHGYYGLEGGRWGGGFLLADTDGDARDDLVQIRHEGNLAVARTWLATSHFSVTLSSRLEAPAAASGGTYLLTGRGTSGAEARHNLVDNGDFQIGPPPRLSNQPPGSYICGGARGASTSWYGGTGGGHGMTWSYLDEPMRFLRVHWERPPCVNEDHHGGHAGGSGTCAPLAGAGSFIRATFLEGHHVGGAVQNVNVAAQRNLIVRFWGRVNQAPYPVVPILWHSYFSGPALKGESYEVFEPSGSLGVVRAAAGPPPPGQECWLGSEWTFCERMITVPRTIDRTLDEVNYDPYTGVGIDYLRRALDGTFWIDVRDVEVVFADRPGCVGCTTFE
jgi:hypothetical protein